jgi:hypothetical protein
MVTPQGGITASGDVEVGQEITLLGRFVSTAGIADTETQTINFYSKDCPYTLRVLEIRFQVISIDVAHFTDGDGGNLDFTVHKGDGAASESFSDLLADVALDDDYVNGEGDFYPTSTVPLVVAQQEIEANKSLRAQLILDPDDTIKGGAGNDPVTIDCMIRCLRVK